MMATAANGVERNQVSISSCSDIDINGHLLLRELGDSFDQSSALVLCYNARVLMRGLKNRVVETKL